MTPLLYTFGMQQKTWLDVEIAALHDPFLHAAVSIVKRGLATKEDALITVALALSESNSRLLEEKKQRLMNHPIGVSVHQAGHR